VTAGETHACAESTTNQAYCWGNNYSGNIGDGTGLSRLTPVAVAGNLSFSQVSAGNSLTCGITPGGKAYCWGEGAYAPAPVSDAR
jgi:alpha-tubulin suppressor-like RCC1 family protein